jgi:hypothetical protein
MAWRLPHVRTALGHAVQRRAQLTRQRPRQRQQAVEGLAPPRHGARAAFDRVQRPRPQRRAQRPQHLGRSLSTVDKGMGGGVLSTAQPRRRNGGRTSASLTPSHVHRILLRLPPPPPPGLLPPCRATAGSTCVAPVVAAAPTRPRHQPGMRSDGRASELLACARPVSAPGVSTPLFHDKKTQHIGKSQSKQPHTMWKRPPTCCRLGDHQPLLPPHALDHVPPAHVI